ncbi:MAG: adenylate synthase [Verrucomicrobiae bacterium]|nr:adenylate synthase [Verrucomicrobiae bacterium]
MSTVPDRLLILWHFAVTRWLPSPGSRLRERRLRRFLRRVKTESPFYRGVERDLPILTKTEFLANFEALNRFGITLEEATEVALRAERNRDFRPELPGGITVGMSSGTSGTRHVFLVSRGERCRWAGEMLGRMLSKESLRQILNPLAPPLRIAFFLRASSNLYTTLGSRRVEFEFYDLTRPFADLMSDLEVKPPDVLIAPATVLAGIAGARPAIRPRQVISVAEVLDDRDREMVENVFEVRVDEVYQATEGFLGCSCREGRLHLNEESLRVEPQWVDRESGRFHPVITDFSRRTQWFVRHRLTDVLRIDPTPCPCGRKTTTLLSVEGRSEEVLWLPNSHGDLAPLYPDVVRQVVYSLGDPPDHYRIEQKGMCWMVHLSGGDPEEVTAALIGLAERSGLSSPEVILLPWSDQPVSEKQKRIRCLEKPA